MAFVVFIHLSPFLFIVGTIKDSNDEVRRKIGDEFIDRTDKAKKSIGALAFGICHRPYSVIGPK